VKTVLTGITTTGAPHIGNYVGAIRPAVAASRDTARTSYFFLADYHSLVKGGDPTAMARSTLEIAASWLAAGLDGDSRARVDSYLYDCEGPDEPGACVQGCGSGQ
jgi:tryptophanyl-tRNA synthetase